MAGEHCVSVFFLPSSEDENDINCSYFDKDLLENCLKVEETYGRVLKRAADQHVQLGSVSKKQRYNEAVSPKDVEDSPSNEDEELVQICEQIEKTLV